jgi:hypothetical protein
MEWVRFCKKDDSSSYMYQGSNSIGLEILGLFLDQDIGYRPSDFFRDWILSDENAWAVSGNITALEKVDDDIYLTDQYSQEENPTELNISRGQLVKLLDEWKEKVYDKKPKEVIIKYENDQFIIETKD